MTAGLAADRGIDLRQQRGRHLHEVDAALIAGGGETGQVADHAAAERQHQRIAPETIGDQHVEYAAGVASVLYCSPSGSMTSTMRRSAQRLLDALGVQRRDRGVADQQHVASRYGGLHVRLLRSSPASDLDRVGAISEVYGRVCMASVRGGAREVYSRPAG